jgi:hypothetical protein
VVGLFKDFYTPRDLERWISITLKSYMKDYEEKQEDSFWIYNLFLYVCVGAYLSSPRICKESF